MKRGTSIIPAAVVAAIPGLSGSAAKLTIAIGKYADRNGKCYPRTDTLMAAAGIKNWNTFSNARAELKSHGLLDWHQRSRRRSIEYSWTTPVPSASEGPPVYSESEGPPEPSVGEDAQSRVPSISAGRVPSTAEELTPHLTPQKNKPPLRAPSREAQKAERTHGPKSDPKPKAKDTHLTRFERFWSEYPRKVGIGAARQAWLKLKPTEEQTEQMLTALERHKLSAQWQKDGGQFIPNPANWLNQERWEDEVDPASTETDSAGPPVPRNPTPEEIALAEGVA